MHIMVPRTVQYEQVGPRRYLILHESNYNSYMPCIRNQMIQDGYEYYNVESLGGGFYKYMYVKRDVLPKPIVWDWRILIYHSLAMKDIPTA